MSAVKERIGFASTIPVEVLIAAGKSPCDLNNLFINSSDPGKLIEKSESAGYPRNTCAWIKGMYQATIESGIKKVVRITEGDCLGNSALMDLLERRGVESVPFSYPFVRQRALLEKEIGNLMRVFGVSERQVFKTKKKLDKIREKLDLLDRLASEEGKVSGLESHFWQISATDFNGDPEKFEKELDKFIGECEERRPGEFSGKIRLAVIGMPTMVPRIFELIEEKGGAVVYDEMPRQFTMPSREKGLYDQYLDFTYPYKVTNRIEDIKSQVKKRGVQGIIHYFQSFCPRMVEDISFKEDLGVPILSIECDRPKFLDGKNRMKIEAFLERWER